MLYNSIATQDSHIEKEYPLQWIKGIGPKRAAALDEAGIASIEDLVEFYPRRYIDARQVIKLVDAPNYLWKSVTIRATVLRVQQFSYRYPSRTQITVTDDTGILHLVYFQYADWIAKQYKSGDEIVAIGYIGMYRGDPQIVHPDFVEKVSESEELAAGKMLPVYSNPQAFKTAKLYQQQIRKMFAEVLQTGDFVKATHEVLPPEILSQYRLPGRTPAVREMHTPNSPEALDEAKKRLIYEELFFLQLRFAVERERKLAMTQHGIRFDISGLQNLQPTTSSPQPSIIKTVLDKLPYSLTKAQQRVLQEIATDMSKADRKLSMHRLVQGDVGSGKTIVALLAMLCAVENGYQCAMLAPTEVLAKQHFNSISALLKDTPIEVAQLIGKQTKKLKMHTLSELAEGRTNIIIGTHALLEENVEFEKLGLIVADEQHKFGVAQRKALMEKYTDAPPDMLIMTATPIPRTLALTLYQDLDVSTIDELPGGRKPITTRIVMPSAQRELFTHIREVVKRGEQVYIVYPQLEKSEKKDVKTATSAYEIFRDKIFPDLKVTLIHGKLTSEEKQEVMRRFHNKEIDILVATSVIEVGIDVANATLMIIGNAERFGLAQLHQLRGRVGRGGKASECILIPSDKLEPKPDESVTSEEIKSRTEALERLQVIERTTNGFEIAKADLAMRGPGDFLGTQQSGILKLKLADIVR
ncbi:MAG TPA: ATP-dependent DNA helicase RecG, partial [Candidatus Kapabacteria bacterium]|nr:ATP-dependent DNA helicase RecG [Candidatus Kapabacteria bacterium]